MAPGVDTQDMLGVVHDTPGQWSRAVADSRLRDVIEASDIRAVVVAGMGGSGIAGDVARLAADQAGTTPVVSVKGYDVPAWLGPDTPVIAVSHSGQTEETLAVVAEARRRGAPVHAVTSGGALAALAHDAGWSLALVPGDLQPRASLPSLVVPVLRALAAWRVVEDPEDVLAALPDALGSRVADDVAGRGAGARLAEALHGQVGVFLGGRGVAALVAQRAACQVSENAEEKAFHAELSEFDHNALVGFATPDPASPFVVVTVVDPMDNSRVTAREQPRVEAMQEGIASHHLLELPTGGWLTRFAAGVLDVDLASVRLALALGRDPTPVDVLVRLKATLARTP